MIFFGPPPQKIYISEHCRTTYYLLPTTYYLLPTTYYLLPTTYYLLPTTYYLLPTTYYLLPTTYYLLPTTYYLIPTVLPTTYYLLPTTYYLLPTTYYLLPTVLPTVLPTTYYLLPTTYYSTIPTVLLDQYCSASPFLPPCLYDYLPPPCRYRTVQHCTRSSIAWKGAAEGVEIKTGGGSHHPRQSGRMATRQAATVMYTIGEVSRYL